MNTVSLIPSIALFCLVVLPPNGVARTSVVEAIAKMNSAQRLELAADLPEGWRDMSVDDSVAVCKRLLSDDSVDVRKILLTSILNWSISDDEERLRRFMLGIEATIQSLFEEESPNELATAIVGAMFQVKRVVLSGPDFTAWQIQLLKRVNSAQGSEREDRRLAEMIAFFDNEFLRQLPSESLLRLLKSDSVQVKRSTFRSIAWVLQRSYAVPEMLNSGDVRESLTFGKQSNDEEIRGAASQIERRMSAIVSQ